MALLAGVECATPTCKSTYHSISLYWPASSGSLTHACNVQYKKDGSDTWLNGFDLVWENRTNIKTASYNHSLEYRGSLVQLTPGTTYDIKLSVPDTKEQSFHPQGPQGIVQFNASGNNVIRYNRVSAGIETNNYFNDAIGGGDNFSPTGFPGADSDVYGNWMGHSMDDSLEIEGGGMNIRVWANFINETYVGVASAACSVGPLYIFRNVMYYSRRSPRGGLPVTFFFIYFYLFF
eukprot:Phypoly_transcript_17703.p1 GENE.Phypoly_transcript_17703~~Phypoly_transcript_17703.p1  ORF type:complete len:252 (+),score=30.53 Phypoly_transcript_17703:56-757(+)